MFLLFNVFLKIKCAFIFFDFRIDCKYDFLKSRIFEKKIMDKIVENVLEVLKNSIWGMHLTHTLS